MSYFFFIKCGFRDAISYFNNEKIFKISNIKRYIYNFYNQNDLLMLYIL